MKSLSKKELVDVVFERLFSPHGYMFREKKVAFPFVQKQQIKTDLKKHLNEKYGFDYSEEELDPEQNINALIHIIKES